MAIRQWIVNNFIKTSDLIALNWTSMSDDDHQVVIDSIAKIENARASIDKRLDDRDSALDGLTGRSEYL